MQGRADTRAPKGVGGNFLLDPVNVYIAINETTAGAGSTSATPLSGSVFGETGGTTASLLTPTRLQTALGTSSVTVTTSNDAGTGNGDINVVSPVAWNNTNTLTLHTAAGTINLNANITAPTGTLTAVSDSGTIAQTNSAATVLANLNLTAGAINASGGFSGGNATLTASGDISVPPTNLSGTLTLISTGGNVTQTGTMVASTLVVNAPAASHTVSLNQANSVGSVSFNTGGAVSFHSDSISLTDSAVGGDLNLVSTVGGINLNGAIVTGGTTGLSALQGITQSGTLSAGGDLALTANSIALSGVVAAGNHQVTFASTLGQYRCGLAGGQQWQHHGLERGHLAGGAERGPVAGQQWWHYRVGATST